MGKGEGYQYPHDAEEGFIPQRCLPEGEGRIYYEPTTHGMEGRVKERLDHWRKQIAEAEGAG
jgi:putative ATPase